MKKILFIGDSITESGRFTDPEHLGNGYVRMIHDFIKITYPKQNFTVLNHGISGHRIPDLAARWDEDVISHNPEFLSISIGVNDVWRQLDQQETEQVDPLMFENIYKEILTKTTDTIKAQIILMEPTLIEENSEAKGNQLLKPYIDVVHHMAEKYSCIIVPTHQAMLQYMEDGGEYSLTTDGVHMNSAGNLLLAKTWLHRAKSLFT